MEGVGEEVVLVGGCLVEVVEGSKPQVLLACADLFFQVPRASPALPRAPSAGCVCRLSNLGTEPNKSMFPGYSTTLW